MVCKSDDNAVTIQNVQKSFCALIKAFKVKLNLAVSYKIKYQRFLKPVILMHQNEHLLKTSRHNLVLS